STFAQGVSTVICTATDTSSNSQSCTFTVTVADHEAPVITGCPGNQTVNTDPGVCTAVASYSPTAADNCDPSVPVVCMPPSGTAFPKGTTHVSCTANDAAGNSSVCEFNVTAVDAQKPSITCPASIVKSADPGVCTTTVSWAAPVASDNCAIASVICVPASGSTFTLGLAIVTCTATDTSSNTASCTFTVTVQD